MKWVCSLIIVLTMLSACTAKQTYRRPSNKTSNDFLQDREDCVAKSGYTGGHFLFGPMIIIFPVAIVLEAINVNHQKDFERCMVSRGYTCTEGCWNVTPDKTDFIAVTPAAAPLSAERKDADRTVSSQLMETTEAVIGNQSSIPTVKETSRDGRFIAYDNGTVLDTKTNLMWAAKDNGFNTNWADAKSYCANYRGGGYSDWRMPTQDELARLYNKNKPHPMACATEYNNFVETEFVNISCYYLWASDTGKSFPLYRPTAAFFGFFNGERASYNQSSSEYMRVLPIRYGK